MSQPILDISNLTFSYGKKEPVFKNISLSVDEGQLVGLLGENGAGKTTLFNLIKGCRMKYSGSVSRRFSDSELISLPQVVTLSGTLKNYEVFDLICCFNRLTHSQAERKLQLRWSEDFFYRYEKIKNKRTYAVSYGEKRWLTISLMLGLCDRSRFFLLDEPAVGIDIQYRMLLWKLIDMIVKEGKTVFFSTHIFDELMRDSIPFFMLSKNGIAHYDNMQMFMTCKNAQTPEQAFVAEILDQ